MNRYTNLKIAIVHDSIQYFGGAERVLLALHQTFPAARVFTSVIAWERLGPFKKNIKEMNIITSWAQHFPLLRKYPLLFRYLLPCIWRSFNLWVYDIIISSSGSQMSHMVQKRRNALHVCYCHTPPRHLYGYKTDYPIDQIWILRNICKLLNYILRKINEKAVTSVDYFIANSKETSRRIRRFYKRDSIVVYPPISIPIQRKVMKKGSYYLSVSRLSRMKHVDLVIRAMNELKVSLHVVGIGPEEKYLKRIAGDTITFLGQVSDEALAREYQGCKTLICAAEDEDFGITPLEAISFGKPVVVYYSGGYKETVKNNVTGLFFYSLRIPAIIKAILKVKTYFISDSQKSDFRYQYGFDRFRQSLIKTIHIFYNHLSSDEK